MCKEKKKCGGLSYQPSKLLKSELDRDCLKESKAVSLFNVIHLSRFSVTAVVECFTIVDSESKAHLEL